MKKSVFGVMVVFGSMLFSACAKSVETKEATQKTSASSSSTPIKPASKPSVNDEGATVSGTEASSTKQSHSNLTQEESDDKLDQVARLQYGEEVEVNNKPSEQHLYEESHYQQVLYKQILGVWRGIKDKKQLKQMGLSEEQIKNSVVEVGFFPDHDMQMRTFGLPAPEETRFIKNNSNGVTVMTGRYIIKDGEIVIYFGRDAMENQTISIKSDVLTLAPVSDKSFKLQYKKVKEWSLLEK